MKIDLTKLSLSPSNIGVNISGTKSVTGTIDVQVSFNKSTNDPRSSSKNEITYFSGTPEEVKSQIEGELGLGFLLE
jgi:hypothetical protein